MTDTLSLAAQAMLEWEPARYPEGGTYYGPVDFVFNGPDRQFISAGLGFASRGPASEPKQRGEWGLSARWSPAWLDGTMGLYYRNFADKLPQVLLTAVGAERQPVQPDLRRQHRACSASAWPRTSAVSASAPRSRHVTTRH